MDKPHHHSMSDGPIPHELKDIAQVMFNRAYLGVLAQGGPSIDASIGWCLYRSDCGRKCSIGHNIPDDRYRLGFEHKDVSLLLDVRPMPIPELEYLTAYQLMAIQPFLGALQRSHDGPAPDVGAVVDDVDVEDHEYIFIFKKDMAALALRYGLTVPNEPSANDEPSTHGEPSLATEPKVSQ